MGFAHPRIPETHRAPPGTQHPDRPLTRFSNGEKSRQAGHRLIEDGAGVTETLHEYG